MEVHHGRDDGGHPQAAQNPCGKYQVDAAHAEGRDGQDPQEVGVSLDGRLVVVPGEAPAMDQSVGIAERDQRVVGEEQVPAVGEHE